MSYRTCFQGRLLTVVEEVLRRNALVHHELPEEDDLAAAADDAFLGLDREK